MKYANLKNEPNRYVSVVDSDPQGKAASSFCPVGYVYKRHVCGTGASTWSGSGTVQRGPIEEDSKFDTAYCQTCGGSCKTIRIECSREFCFSYQMFRVHLSF